MKKKEKETKKEYDTIEYNPEEITKMKKDVEFFGVSRKKNSIKELRKEMDERSVGYMTNWTKPVLIKRLEEEDERDAVLITVMQEKENFKITQREKAESYQRAIKLINRNINEVTNQIDEYQENINNLCTRKEGLMLELEEAKVSLKILNL